MFIDAVCSFKQFYCGTSRASMESFYLNFIMSWLKPIWMETEKTLNVTVLQSYCSYCHVHRSLVAQ